MCISAFPMIDATGNEYETDDVYRAELAKLRAQREHLPRAISQARLLTTGDQRPTVRAGRQFARRQVVAGQIGRQTRVVGRPAYSAGVGSVET